MAHTEQLSPQLSATDPPVRWCSGLRRRLDLHIFALVLGFSLLLSLITTSIWVWVAYRQQVTIITSTFDRMEQGFVAPLAHSLWEFDDEALAAEIQAIASQPGIAFVKLIAQNGKIFTAGTLPNKQQINRTVPIHFMHLNRQVPVGELAMVGDSRKAMAEVVRTIGPIYLFQLILVGGVASFFFLLFNRMITRHLMDIAAYLPKLGLGIDQPDLTLHRRRRNDELDRVVDTINSMRENLHVAQQAQADSMEMFSRTFYVAPLLMTISNLDDGTYIEVNDTFVTVSGYSREESIGKRSAELGWITAEDREELKRELLIHGRVVAKHLTLQAKNGKSVNCLYFGEVITFGARTCLLSIALDISERLRAEQQIIQLNNELEQRVAERTAQLIAANHELESFSYSVSHDLRAPVRHISSFAQMLAEECSATLSADAQHFLRRVLHSSTLMGEMIEGLLQISRLNRTPLNREEVDLSLLAGEIAESLRAESIDRVIEWSIASGVRVCGDPVLLRLVLQNLLGNAWKYSAKKAVARIEFGEKVHAGERVYYVKDNGAGFDPEYADRLFTAFQRLHSSDEFSGIGIGLATVQRIVALHGGRVWAEGEMDVGSTFSFTIAAGQVSPGQ